MRCTDGRGAPPPEDSGEIWDWDAAASPAFELAEAQAGLALWEVERALPEISQLLRHVALLPAEQSSATCSTPPTPTDRSPSTRPPLAMPCAATSG